MIHDDDNVDNVDNDDDNVDNDDDNDVAPAYNDEQSGADCARSVVRVHQCRGSLLCPARNLTCYQPQWYAWMI